MATRATGMSRGLRGLMTLIIIVAMGVVYSIPSSANHPGPASGLGVEPEFTQGNPTCGQFFPGTEEFKVEPVEDGMFPDPDGPLTVTIDVRNELLQGQVFDFLATGGSVLGVVVKGGPNANLYDYEDQLGHGVSGKNIGDWTDTGLHAPVNHSNTMFYGLSHISFCYLPGASLEIVKVDSEGNLLAGADFSVYRDDGDGAEGDPATGFEPGTDDELVGSCTTDDDPTTDECVFDGLTIGDSYWVHETDPPAGYEVVGINPRLVTLPSDGITVEFTNSPETGQIDVTKTDDDDPANGLSGVTFRLYVDEDGDGDFDFTDTNGDGLFDPATESTDETFTNKTCTTDTTGVCREDGGSDADRPAFDQLDPGDYCVVEDPATVGTEHQVADPNYQCGTVDIADGGDTLSFSFANPRLHKVIVIVCHEGTGTLAASDVDNGTDSLTTPAEGSTPNGISESDLCGLDGFDGKAHGDKSITVDVGSDAHS